jgi:hypothetical protein
MVLAAANVVLALAVAFILIIQSNWIGLAAIATFSAVLWAVYQIMPFELNSPLFQKAPEFHPTTSQRVGSVFFVNVLLENIGETLAKSCQPVVMAVGRYDAGKWQKGKNKKIGFPWVSNGFLMNCHDPLLASPLKKETWCHRNPTTLTWVA